MAEVKVEERTEVKRSDEHKSDEKIKSDDQAELQRRQFHGKKDRTRQAGRKICKTQLANISD